jgi:REP element-mobilizing transposase RayT
MLKRPKQLSLLTPARKNTKLWWITEKSTYGGSMNYRKVARPFDSKKLTHAVLKAKLPGAIRFTKSQQSIRRIIDAAATEYSVKLKDLAINHDHIHLLFHTGRRENQACFLRLVAAELGRKYKLIRKQFGITSKGSIWIARPFTRLVSWNKKCLKIVKNYFAKNRDEASGFLEYKPRSHRLNSFLAQWRAELTPLLVNTT